jgi:hypothetical protein
MDEYKRALNNKTICKTMYNIQSDNHELYTEEINKIALYGDDDKRHRLADGINTLALKHYSMMLDLLGVIRQLFYSLYDYRLLHA